MSACIPMNEKIIGDKMATAILLIRLYEISVGTFPPSIPVMTGAAVAVGQKNTVLAIWLALTYLSPITSIGPASYIIWQNSINSYQLYLKEKQTMKGI